MKPIKLDTIPEEVNGMKTRLFARYINWFNKKISPHNFYFNYILSKRESAVKACKVLSRRPGDEYDILFRLVTAKGHHCDSVGCFTGWSIKCGFLITDAQQRIENEKNPYQRHSTTQIDSDEFGRIIGMSHKIANFMFMPDNIYPYQSGRIMSDKETAAWQDVGAVTIFVTKMEMLHRCVRFLNYVVDGTIDPNPTARMSEAEASHPANCNCYRCL